MKHGFAFPIPGFTGSNRNILALALGLAFAPASIAAETGPAAKVGVYAKHAGGKIVYYYLVTNRSQQDITSVSIGHDTMNDDDPGNDVWELSELPSGWNPKLGIPAANSNAPTGWRVSMTTPVEESKTHAITWEIMNAKSPVISSGQTQAKMSIALDKADASYLTGHALVVFSDRSGATAAKDPAVGLTVPVVPIDSRPPTLEVTLTPNTIWSPDDKHIPVNVTFAAKEDDYDNLPEIRLESITANEPLEPGDIHDASFGLDDRHIRLRAKHNGSTSRIYTVNYSATDASGNQSTASATVTVPAAAPPVAPHAQGEKTKIEAK